MKKYFCAVLTVLLSLSVLSGCAPQSSSDEPSGITGTTAVIQSTGSQPSSTVPAATREQSSRAEQQNTGDLYFSNQDIRESPAWVTQLDAVNDTQQLIVVAGVDKNTAYVTMHEKDAEGKWQQIIATPGFIGLDGLGNADVYHSYTPIGTFTIDKAFGLADDPGCQMEYTKVDGDYYWSCDSREGMHFNELVNIKDVPGLDTDSCERIADYDYAYQYVLNMGYNCEGIPEKGCAFFFHCFRVNRPYTGGCVAVPENIMKFIMQHIKPGCKITIDYLENMNGSLDE